MGLPDDFIGTSETTFKNTIEGIDSQDTYKKTAGHIDLLEDLGESGDWVSKWLAPVTGSNAGKNYQAEYVDPKQIITDDSSAPLVLKLSASGEGEGDGQPLLGAQIETGDIFKPGMYLEIDMSVPNLAPGMWPALWLDGDKTSIADEGKLVTYVDPEWPSKGEFDLFEHGGMLDRGDEVVGSQWDDDAFFSTVHCDHIQGNGLFGYTWNLQDCTSGGCSITDPYGAYVQGNNIDGKNMSLVGRCVGEKYTIQGEGPQKLSGNLCCKIGMPVVGGGGSCWDLPPSNLGICDQWYQKDASGTRGDSLNDAWCKDGTTTCTADYDKPFTTPTCIGPDNVLPDTYYICSDGDFPCEQVVSSGAVCTSMGACLSPQAEGIPDSIFDIDEPPYFNGIDSNGGKCKWHSDGTGACTDAMKDIIHSKTNWADCMAQGATLATSNTPGCMACWQDNTTGESIDLYDTSTPSYCYDPALGPNDTLSARACPPTKSGTVEPRGCVTLGGASITTRNSYGLYWSSDGKTVCTYVNGTLRGCRNIQYGILNCQGDADEGTGVFNPKHVIINLAAGGALGGGDDAVDKLLADDGDYRDKLDNGDYRMEIYSAKIYNVLIDLTYGPEVILPAILRNACVNLGESTDNYTYPCCPGQGTPSTSSYPRTSAAADADGDIHTHTYKTLGDICVPGGQKWAQGAANMGETVQNSPNYTQMNTGTGFNAQDTDMLEKVMKELHEPWPAEGENPRAGYFALPCEGGPPERNGEALEGYLYQCFTNGTWSCQTEENCTNNGGTAYYNVTKNWPNLFKWEDYNNETTGEAGDARSLFNGTTDNVFAVGDTCFEDMWGRSCDDTDGKGCEGYGFDNDCYNWSCDANTNTCKPLGYIDPDASFENAPYPFPMYTSGHAWDQPIQGMAGPEISSCNRGPFDTAPNLTNFKIEDGSVKGVAGWSDAYQNIEVNRNHCSVAGAEAGLHWAQQGTEIYQEAYSCCPGTRCVQGDVDAISSDFCCPDGYTDSQCQSIWANQLQLLVDFEPPDGKNNFYTDLSDAQEYKPWIFKDGWDWDQCCGTTENKENRPAAEGWNKGDVPPWGNWGVTPGGMDPYQYGNCVDCVEGTVPCLNNWDGDDTTDDASASTPSSTTPAVYNFLCAEQDPTDATKCGFADAGYDGVSYEPGCAIQTT